MITTNQLATLDIERLNGSQSTTNRQQLVNTNQQDLIQLIQETIRNEANNHQNSQFTGNYSRYNRKIIMMEINATAEIMAITSGYITTMQSWLKDSDQRSLQQQKQPKN